MYFKERIDFHQSSKIETKAGEYDLITSSYSYSPISLLKSLSEVFDVLFHKRIPTF